MSTIQFNPIHSDQELKQVEQLANEIWRAHYTPIIGEAQVEYMLEKFQSYTAMKNQISNEAYCYYSITDQNQLIGYFAYKLEHDALFLSKLYLHEKSRGLGAARLACQLLEEIAKKNDRHQLKLTVNKYNHNSIAAYIKMGFKSIDEVVMDIGAGYVMDDFVLVRQID